MNCFVLGTDLGEKWQHLRQHSWQYPLPSALGTNRGDGEAQVQAVTNLTIVTKSD